MYYPFDYILCSYVFVKVFLCLVATVLATYYTIKMIKHCIIFAVPSF